MGPEVVEGMGEDVSPLQFWPGLSWLAASPAFSPTPARVGIRSARRPFVQASAPTAHAPHRERRHRNDWDPMRSALFGPCSVSRHKFRCHRVHVDGRLCTTATSTN